MTLREFDARVAEYLIGQHDTGVAHYSSDIAAAWEVVAAMQRKGYRLKLEQTKVGWYAHFTTEGWSCGRDAETAPLAICLAAWGAWSGGTIPHVACAAL